MASPQIITLLTDFGTTDAYAGIVKGVLLGRAPDARVVDLVHAADFGSLHATGYLLASAFAYFPAGTVHLVLADPSSAPDRRIITAEVAGQFVVAPDNGIAAPLFEQHRPSAVVVVQDPKYLIKPPRHTFHSRLIYAPAAAALVNGARLEELGSPTSEWTRLPRATGAVEPDGSIVGEVVHVDRFGNLVTNIDASQLPPHPRITVGSTVIDRVSDAYSDVDPGGSPGDRRQHREAGNQHQSRQRGEEAVCVEDRPGSHRGRNRSRLIVSVRWYLGHAKDDCTEMAATVRAEIRLL